MPISNLDGVVKMINHVIFITAVWKIQDLCAGSALQRLSFLLFQLYWSYLVIAINYGS